MSATPVLSVEDIRTYISDRPENNHLLDGVEFSDAMIDLSMRMAISEFNNYAPKTGYTVFDFPNIATLMSGTLFKLFAGQAALLARNTMNYSDGGIQIPIEERAELYSNLAAMYEQDFRTATIRIKTAINIESGWGEVSSDYATFPYW